MGRDLDPRRVRRIRDRLREIYGIPAAPPHQRGLDELILTVLSQSTNDRNRDVAFLRLRRRFGAWEAVRDAPNEEVDGPHLRDRDFLLLLPGVGRKTAACVLLFAYGEREIPVDTHVSRVGGRLHLWREKANFEEMHDEMLAITPRGQELEFHVNLLRHGRRTCHARRPDCGKCALLRMCPTGYNLRHPD
jgi:endonuclease-3